MKCEIYSVSSTVLLGDSRVGYATVNLVSSRVLDSRFSVWSHTLQAGFSRVYIETRTLNYQVQIKAIQRQASTITEQAIDTNIIGLWWQEIKWKLVIITSLTL